MGRSGGSEGRRERRNGGRSGFVRMHTCGRGCPISKNSTLVPQQFRQKSKVRAVEITGNGVGNDKDWWSGKRYENKGRRTVIQSQRQQIVREEREKKAKPGRRSQRTSLRDAQAPHALLQNFCRTCLTGLEVHRLLAELWGGRYRGRGCGPLQLRLWCGLVDVHDPHDRLALQHLPDFVGVHALPWGLPGKGFPEGRPKLGEQGL